MLPEPGLGEALGMRRTSGLEAIVDRLGLGFGFGLWGGLEVIMDRGGELKQGEMGRDEALHGSFEAEMLCHCRRVGTHSTLQQKTAKLRWSAVTQRLY